MQWSLQQHCTWILPKAPPSLPPQLALKGCLPCEASGALPAERCCPGEYGSAWYAYSPAFMSHALSKAHSCQAAQTQREAHHRDPVPVHPISLVMRGENGIPGEHCARAHSAYHAFGILYLPYGCCWRVPRHKILGLCGKVSLEKPLLRCILQNGTTYVLTLKICKVAQDQCTAKISTVCRCAHVKVSACRLERTRIASACNCVM